jgi:stage V sporulation protein G
MSLEISKVRVNKVNSDKPDNKTVALATVLLNETFAINKIQVINGEKGLFVSMPRRKNGKGEYEDICHPVTGEFRELLNKSVLDEYAKLEG